MTTSPAFSGGSIVWMIFVLLALVVPQRPAATQAGSLDLMSLLDAYAQGRYDEALAAARVAAKDRVGELRQQIVLQGGAWVERVATDRDRRALAAAAFVLETERIRAERGEWDLYIQKGCGSRCTIEWACTLLQTRTIADPGERTWMLASMALAGGVRDWSFLQTPLSAPTAKTVERGHAHHALARFPDDQRLRLARAVALASRHAVVDEMEAPRDGVRTEAIASQDILIVRAPELGPLIQQRRTRSLAYATDALEALVSDEPVGVEARIRLGYLHRVSGDEGRALAAWRAAADLTKDADLAYLAKFLIAQTLQAQGDLSGAEANYRAALEARPGSQSATLGLGALLYVRGEGSQAYDLMNAARSGRGRDDDPWRLFLYGDFPKLPALVTELRRQLTS